MAEAKIIIKAQDKTKDGINSASSNLKKLSDAASKLGINLKSLTAVGVTVAALKKLGEAAKKCCEDFLETENAYLTLKNALGNTYEYSKAISSINKLSKTTLSSKEDVTALYTTLVQLGKGDEEINKIIEASISLSNVTGKSLTESFNVMLDSLDGSVGTLQKYLPEVKNMTKEELALGKAVDAVNKAFSETAKSISTESYSQHIKNIKDGMQTISEGVGELFLSAISPVLSLIEEQIASLEEMVEQAKVQQDRYDRIKTTTGRFDTGSSADAITELFYDIEGPVGFDNLSYLFNSIDDRLSEVIVDAESAYGAFEALKYLVEEDLIDTASHFYKTAMELILSIDSSIPTVYFNKNALPAEQKSSKIESVGIWGSNTHLEDQATTVFNTIMNGWFEVYDDILKDVSAPVSLGDNYGENDTESIKLVHDYEVVTNKYLEYNSIFSQHLDEIAGELKSLGYSDAQINSLMEGYKTSFEAQYADIINNYTELFNNLPSEINSAISSFSGNYLSEFAQGIYDDSILEQNLATLEELYTLCNRIYGETDYRTIILQDMLYNMENGIDLNLPSNVKSILGSNTKYLSDETLKEYEIATLESSIADMQATFDKAVEQMALGNGEYTDLDLKMMDEIISGQQKELNELKNPTPEETTKLEWSSFSDIFKDSYDRAINTESIDTSLLDSLSDSFESLFEAIEPLVNVVVSSNPVIAFLIKVVKEMTEILSPFLSNTIKPFTDLIHTFAESLSEWITPILNVVKGVLSGICDILEMVFLPILEMITPLIEGICGILQILKPVMEWLKTCFIDIGTVFTFVTDAFKYAIWSFLNWLDDLSIFGWKPFEGVGGYDVSSLDSYDSGTGGLNIANTKKSLQEKYAYDPTDWTATGEDTSTSTSVSTASYTGANNYYFNIYQQAPVVGDGGMQEFAKMIKMEFAELAYIGA